MEQPGDMRTREETLDEIIQQFRDGIKGTNIQKRQTETGVKDSNLTYWLENHTQRESLLNKMGVDPSGLTDITELQIIEVINAFFSLTGESSNVNTLLYLMRGIVVI